MNTKKINAAVSSPEAVTVKPVQFGALKIAALLLIAFALLGMAGTIEYQDDVYYSIPEAAMEEIVSKAGGNVTRESVIEEYLSDREYYDSLEDSYGISEISQNF